MKQGTASRSGPGDQKVEPKANAQDVRAVSAIGQAVAYIKPDLKDGRGYMAPAPKSETSHKGGSQGRH